MNIALQRCAIVLAISALAGCRTGEDDFPRIVNEPMPVSPAQRSSFGVIGVLPADLAAHFEFGLPASPGEAADVIGARAFISLADTSMESDEGRRGRQMEEIAFSAALADVIGAFGGVLAGVPEGDVKRAQSAMSQALHDNPLEPGVETRLERLAAKKHCPNLVPVPETVRAWLKGNAVRKENLPALSGSGIDSVLCLQAEGERFVPGGGLNPPMAVDINLRLQIVRVTDGRVLFDKTLVYQGNRQIFTNWGAHKARLFRTELLMAQRTFAAVIFTSFQID